MLFDKNSTFAFVSCDLEWKPKWSWAICEAPFVHDTVIIGFDYVRSA